MVSTNKTRNIENASIELATRSSAHIGNDARSGSKAALASNTAIALLGLLRTSRSWIRLMGVIVITDVGTAVVYASQRGKSSLVQACFFWRSLMVAANISYSSAASTENLYLAGKSSSASPSRTMENILVALDLSTPSVMLIQTAVRFASTLHAKLFVAHVFEYSDAGIVEGVIGLRQESKRRLDNIVRKINHEKAVAQSVMRYGPAAPTILKIIKDKNIDLAIVGTKNKAGMERFVFGSAAEAVFRRAPCPMVTIGPEVNLDKSTHTQDPIVFATDLNPRFFHAIRYAAYLSKAFGAPLHCIQVLPPSTDTHGAPIISAIMTGALKHLIEENHLDERCVCSNIYGKQVSKTIVEYANERKAQLIVLGIQRTSALASHLSPHITYEVVADAPCPVLTVSL